LTMFVNIGAQPTWGAIPQGHDRAKWFPTSRTLAAVIWFNTVGGSQPSGMARTPQSNAVKRRRGVRTSRLNADELPTLPGELTAPPWLPADDRVAELFAVIVADLAPAAVEMVDRHAVAMLALALRDSPRAELMLDDPATPPTDAA
jgi:hypothetical protein